MKVDLIDRMGSDLSVVNAARVSYGKVSEELSEKDKKLLQYLASNKHWTPFAHPQLTFRIKASIQVARQLFRHTVGLAINEISRRYVDDKPEFEVVKEWRGRPGKGQSKQGSSGRLKVEDQHYAECVFDSVVMEAEAAYKNLLRVGVAPEQARFVLPMATLTEWIWTGSLYAFIRVCKERLAGDAQSETRDVVVKIYEHLVEHYPESVRVWGVGDGQL